MSIIVYASRRIYQSPPSASHNFREHVWGQSVAHSLLPQMTGTPHLCWHNGQVSSTLFLSLSTLPFSSSVLFQNHHHLLHSSPTKAAVISHYFSSSLSIPNLSPLSLHATALLGSWLPLVFIPGRICVTISFDKRRFIGCTLLYFDLSTRSSSS